MSGITNARSDCGPAARPAAGVRGNPASHRQAANPSLARASLDWMEVPPHPASPKLGFASLRLLIPLPQSDCFGGEGRVRGLRLNAISSNWPTEIGSISKKYQYISYLDRNPQTEDWQRLARSGEDWRWLAKLGLDWLPIGGRWRGLAGIGKDWRKLAGHRRQSPRLAAGWHLPILRAA